MRRLLEPCIIIFVVTTLGIFLPRAFPCSEVKDCVPALEPGEVLVSSAEPFFYRCEVFKPEIHGSTYYPLLESELERYSCAEPELGPGGLPLYVEDQRISRRWVEQKGRGGAEMKHCVEFVGHIFFQGLLIFYCVCRVQSDWWVRLAGFGNVAVERACQSAVHARGGGHSSSVYAGHLPAVWLCSVYCHACHLFF